MDNSRLKKSLLSASVLLALGAHAGLASATDLGANNNNFTMLSPGGGAVGGTNIIKATWDGTLNTSVETAVSNMTISSPSPFFGVVWFAHDVQLFGPGSYTFEGCPGPMDPVTFKSADGSTNCSIDNTPQTMVVGEGQVGVHMLFDWNSSVNIDVVNVWNMNAPWAYAPNDGGTASVLQSADSACSLVGKFADPTTPECIEFLSTEWLFTTTDGSGNGIPGAGMVDGPFKGFVATFNIQKVAVFDDAVLAAQNTSVKAGTFIENDQLPTTTGNFVVTGFDVTTEKGGVVTDNGDGTFNYLPPVDYVGLDSFTYTVGDGVDHSWNAFGEDGHFMATAKASVMVFNDEAALKAASGLLEATSSTSSAAGDSNGSGESGGVGASGLFALPLMLLLLPLRLFSRRRTL